jgi:tetratricopeptide (TPR) repeat protein
VEFLRRLLGRTDHSAPAPPPALAREPSATASLTVYGDHFAQIDELDLMGSYVRSPDGRLVLVCGTVVDPAGAGARGGGYAVLDGRQVVVSGRAERPQEGRIADNGIFLFNDWLHNDALCGRCKAFSADGTPLIDAYFDANLLGNGLSDDGRYAICQTASAPGSPDSTIVAAFDLAEKRALARWQPECGTARDFAFDSAAGTVDLITHDGDRETYDLATGAMRDREAWLARRIARGDLRVIAALLKDADLPAAEAIEHIRAGLAAAQADGDGWSRARAFRLDGELLERLERPGDALAAYDKALALDPQVGVARRADKMRREAAGPSAPPAPKRSRFKQQAARLGIRHERLTLERGGPKAWRHGAEDPFASVEIAALAHYRREGWSGCASEGGLILTLIKAASFARLDPRHADTFIEALYQQNVAWPADRSDPAELVANVAAADMARIERNWTLICATAGVSPAYYPAVDRDHVVQCFKTLGAARLAEIARLFATAPYDLRAGWPDLTLWRGEALRFVEVKSPSDQMHASQARLISTLLVPLGFDVTLAEVVAAK